MFAQFSSSTMAESKKIMINGDAIELSTIYDANRMKSKILII